MQINCENCGKEILQASSTCIQCGFDNREIVKAMENIESNKCCDNCKHYEPTEDIQCKALAKIHKWDRSTLEIDCPDSFVCGGYNG